MLQMIHVPQLCGESLVQCAQSDHQNEFPPVRVFDDVLCDRVLLYDECHASTVLVSGFGWISSYHEGAL
jgi:hypothetical protein